MRDEDKWPAIHAYRKAVANGDAPEIKCPDCNSGLVPVLGTDGDPELKCLACRTVFNIGLDVWDQIRANIREVAQNLKERNV